MDLSSLSPQLLQLLGSKLSLNASEVEALQAGDYTRLLGERLANDPALAGNPMLGMLMNSFGSPAAEDDPTEDEEDEAADVVDVSAVDDDVASRALEALGIVAEILGACRCWGQDRECRECDGRGKPGTARSRDPETFLRWVQPNLRRMGYRLVHTKHTDRTISKTED